MNRLSNFRQSACGQFVSPRSLPMLNVLQVEVYALILLVLLPTLRYRQVQWTTDRHAISSSSDGLGIRHEAYENSRSSVGLRSTWLVTKAIPVASAPISPDSATLSTQVTMGCRQVLGPFMLALLLVLARSFYGDAKQEKFKEVRTDDVIEEASHGVTAEHDDQKKAGFNGDTDGKSSSTKDRHSFPESTNSFQGTWTMPDQKSQWSAPLPQSIPFRRPIKFESPASLQDLSTRADSAQHRVLLDILGDVTPDTERASLGEKEGSGRSMEEKNRHGYNDLAQAPLVMAELYKGPVRGESPPNPVGTGARNLLNASKTNSNSAEATNPGM